MFESGVKEFELNGKTYPYKCSLLVLEKLQDRYGDLIEIEDKLRGFVPKVDADGVVDRTSGRFTLPDIGIVCQSLIWMIEEGIDITGAEIEPLTEKELKRQEDYPVIQLAQFPFAEFEECVAGKKSKREKAPEK